MTVNEEGFESLHYLKSVDPPLWLAPSADLSRTAREASCNLFSLLKPFCPPNSPFDALLIDGFDAEQIWHQIDLQSQPLLSNLRREVRRFEKKPKEISKLFEEKKKKPKETSKVEDIEVSKGEPLGGVDGDQEEEDEDMQNVVVDDDDSDDDDAEEEEEEEEEAGGFGADGIEDKFLKIKDLEEYLEDGEAEEYGLKKDTKRDGRMVSDEEDEEGDYVEDDDDEDNELGVFADADDGNGSDELETARYEDFFGSKKQKDSKKVRKPNDGLDDLGIDDALGNDKKNEKQNLSTHEKELLKIQSKIEEVDKARLQPKDWTMQGEVSAYKRPKNSALEVDIDFEHNVRPPPVITEEITASLEDLIRQRIAEERFNDVQRAPRLPSKAPKELKELDENKSKKGLAEVYEEEYAQQTGLTSGKVSFSDEQKNEASMLLKRLCLKLDALSHFHFTPKPVIEDMSIQTNVPALLMEEVAPVMVSDAAMLAPEEIFAGKGDVKEEAELTTAERKRRRSNKKRKFKSEMAKRMQNKAPQSLKQNHVDGKEQD